MIHYEVRGDDGPWLVFVHGLTCAGDDWDAQVAALMASHRCLSVDLRGHGRSADKAGPYDIDTMAGDVAGLMHGLAIEDAVLVGHSMGTRVISAVTMQVPERVRGLVFVDGSQQATGDPFAAIAGAQTLLGDDPAVPGFIERMFAAMFTADSDPGRRAAIVARATAMPAPRFRALLSGMLAWDAGRLEPVLAQIRQPVVVLQSTRLGPDRVRRSLAAGERTPYLDMLAARLADVRIEIVPDVGHFTQIEAADTVNAAVAALAAR